MRKIAPKDQEKKDSNRHTVTKPVSKKEENQDSNKATKNKERDNECNVFEAICGPVPSLGLPYWDYNINMVIHDYLEGTNYTVPDLVEGCVHKNSHPTGKERK